MKSLVIVTAIALIPAASPATQRATPRPQEKPTASCTTVRAEQNPEFRTTPTPAIYGTTLHVPRMRVSAFDTETNRQLEIQQLRILYAWEWLDYPYPGSEFGNWSAAWDTTQCVGARAGTEVEVPAYDLKPRGYYGGHFARYPFARPPHVTRIVLEFLVTDVCRRKVELSAGQAERLTKDALVLRTSCSPQASASERQGRLVFERAR